jgi:nucleotidyltransferase/DNA polymerase involved in DNA repair
MVEDELEDEAGATFHELKSAYNQNDLSRVREIWESLESEKQVNVSSTYGQDLKKIKMEIVRLKSQLKIVKSDLKELKDSPSFIQVIILDDWDEYFEEKKRKLEQEIQHMMANA